ncbi:MAG TPA: glycosyl hydrolase [Verrucomicrobiae bacterium]|nr:glycosyl hydrolase [Verrucomicrobiae bacterium]
MKSPGKCSTALGVFISLAATFSAIFSAAAADDLSWPQITSENRPWTWWWWHGSAVDQTNIAHELQRFHDAGLGGAQITAIYGVKGAESRDIQYLSPEWLQMMGYTVDDAKRLGMGVTMTLGSGWCFGGPTVSDKDANALVVAKTFEVKGGGQLTEKFNRDSTQSLMAFPEKGEPVELTDRIAADGSVNWTAPAGSWTIYAISQKPSGQKVKRPGPGGEGWMLNPLYPQAMTDWLKWFDGALADYHGSRPLAVFQDSYEYRTDWAPDFLAQFEKRRGYKLQNELPALFGTNNDEHTARVKYDYRRTVSEIMAEESEPAWVDWAHAHGFQTIYQAHGTPGNWLDLYAAADIPETEMFHNDRSILISKFASSAAHVAGHPLTGAETGTWMREHFTGTLGELKNLADDMFLSGVNRIFYHGTCYSPDDAPWPGWLFYASTEMNPRNSIWHDVPALNEYIARCQSILQSGKPDNDILLYWPVADFWSQPEGMLQPMAVGRTDWFENQPIGKTAHELWDRGYAFDYVSDAQLQTAKVVDGKIQMPGGDYKVIVVPECKYIPYKTFEQLLSLAEKGAAVIFEKSLPGKVSGFANEEEQDWHLQRMKMKLMGIFENSAENKNYGKGSVLLDSAENLLALWRVGTPHETMTDDGLSFIRRSFDGGWNYLIVNRGGTNFDGWITLSRPVKSAEILDPITGKTGLAAENEKGQIHLPLTAGESAIVRAFDHAPVETDSFPRWNYFAINGTPTGITGRWNVKFISGGPTLPAETQIGKLASWTTFPDTNCQSFGGTAKYEITFDAPKSAVENYYLDLGDIRQSAHVKLNGKDYGTLITSPFRVVVDNLRPTGNKLEIEVTSVDANRIRDLDRRGVNWKYFKDINIVNINYRPFDASDWPLTDCGLLGPVTLTPAVAEKN